MKIRFVIVSALSVLCLMLAACSTGVPTSTQQVVKPADTVYPPPDVQPTIDPRAVPFKLNKPILENAKEVTGTGAPGVPIILADMTTMGEILAETTVRQDGTFTFQVQNLKADHRIGIALGDLQRTKWKIEDFQNRGYNGDEARLVPMVGYFYDSFLVQPAK